MKIGTRGSTLALAQTKMIADILIRELGIQPEIVTIRTQGDRFTDQPFREFTGRGYFTLELEEALLCGQIDAAVHSFKDMPPEAPEGLSVAAVSEREDPADLLIVRPEAFAPGVQEIPLNQGVVVGTSAVRRATQLKHLRRDIQIKDLRGNLPTRLYKLTEGQYDAIFLASAGVNLLKLDLSEFNVVRLDPTTFIPSPGQGALAVQMREGHRLFSEVQRILHHETTWQATRLERDVMGLFGGGYGLMLGVYAHYSDNNWRLYGYWGGTDDQPVWTDVEGDLKDNLAEQLHRKLTLAPVG